MRSKITPINFALQSYQASSGLASFERALNIYAEPTPSDSSAPAKVLLKRTPGTKLWSNIMTALPVPHSNSNPVYGFVTMGSYIYIVCGITLYRANANKDFEELGTLGTVQGRVMMTQNGVQVTILTETGRAYYYDTNNNTFGEITNPNYLPSSSVITSSNYTIFTQSDSQTWFLSGIRDTTAYSVFDQAQAEAISDDLVTVASNNSQVYLMGDQSIEVWNYNGGVTFPYQRISAAFIPVGPASKYSVVMDIEGIFWLGSDRRIYTTGNYTANPISSYGVDTALASYQTIKDAFAFIYSQDGHRFYCITFPSEGKTWCYDLTTKLWHERSSTNPITRQQDRWLPNCYAYFDGKHLVGDPRVGKIYELSSTTYSDADGELPILVEAISATQFNNYIRTAIHQFILWMDAGVGLDGSDQGVNPQIMMDFSNDGGKSWSTELWQPLGRAGEYLSEIYWNQLGVGRSLIVRVRVSDPVPINITSALVRISESGNET